MRLTEGQEQALEAMKAFVMSNEEQVFILRGYAGTGKTTLLRQLIGFLDSQNQRYSLMAPTGRAAKVLSDTLGGSASTIHRRIYKFVYLKEKEADGTKEYCLYYKVLDADFGSVVIIDEASMVPIKKSFDDHYVMGSGSLSMDLLQFANPKERRTKLIFVGDPAQLPPVGESISTALRRETFEELGLRVMEATLTEVVRQAEGSLVLENATLMRRYVEEEKGMLALSYDDISFRQIQSHEFSPLYLRLYPRPSIDSGLMIAYTNKRCKTLNQEVRSSYFPRHPEVAVGDRLLVVANNMAMSLVNGDLVMVQAVYPQAEVQGVNVGNNQVVTLVFRDLLINVEGMVIKSKILENLLYSDEPRMSKLEAKAVYIFTLQKLYEEYGFNLQGEALNKALQGNEYYNALQCKFGYAITCHKAQGGEWDTVLIDYAGRNNLSLDELRWCYTATTRATNCCYVANPPTIDEAACYEGVQPIIQLSKPPMLPQATSNLSDGSPVERVYKALQGALAGLGYEITHRQALQYQERYTVRHVASGLSFQISGFYNKAGVFSKGFKVTKGELPPGERARVEPLLASPESYSDPVGSEEAELSYIPSGNAYQFAYGLVSRASELSGVGIKAIQENDQQYYVRYFLATNGQADAYLDCYRNGKDFLTKIIPYLYNQGGEQKLKQLLNEISRQL